MNCRTLSHRYATSSSVLRPFSVALTTPVKPQALPRCRRTALRTVATAFFAAPGLGADALASSPAELQYPIKDVSDPQIASIEAFEDILKSAGDKLVVVMCKASGCRPCKTFRPRFGLLATLFSDASFYEVIGDRNDSTKTLMRSQKVRATPTFLFFRNGERVHDHSGIKAEKMLEALKATVLPGEAGYTEDFARAAEFLEAKPTN